MDTGPVVMPGDPTSSRLLRAVGYAGKVKMPPTGKLPDAEIDALTKWVEMGAPWPKKRLNETGSKPCNLYVSFLIVSP